MRMTKRVVLLWLVMLGTIMLLAALSAQESPIGYVSDFAHVLDGAERDEIERMITECHKATGNQIAVVTVPTLGGASIDEYSVRLFERWKIGQANVHNGLLILLAPSERKVRIETGYGTEELLSASAAGEIIRLHAIPYFKTGAWAAGLRETTAAVIAKVNVALPAPVPSADGGGSNDVALWLFGGGVVCAVVFFAGVVVTSRRRQAERRQRRLEDERAAREETERASRRVFHEQPQERHHHSRAHRPSRAHGQGAAAAASAALVNDEEERRRRRHRDDEAPLPSFVSSPDPSPSPSSSSSGSDFSGFGDGGSSGGGGATGDF